MKRICTFRRLIAHALDKTVNVGTILCHSENKDRLCDELGRSEGLAFYPAGQIDKEHEKELSTLDVKEVHREVIRVLPEIRTMGEEDYRTLLDTLDEPKKEGGLLVLFVSQRKDVSDELKKLAHQIDSSAEFLLADCSKLSDGCEGIRIGSLPRLAYFRPEGNFIIHYGNPLFVGRRNYFFRQVD